MAAFRDRLNAAGIVATIRASRGEDIEAACGMLAGKKADADKADAATGTTPTDNHQHIS